MFYLFERTSRKKGTTMKIKTIWLLAMGFIGFLTSGLSASPNIELHQLFDKDWQARVDRSPMLSTRLGNRDANHLLQDVSEKAYDNWANISRGFLKELASIDYAALTRDDQINYQIFKRQLERRINEIEYKSFQIPFLSDSGFHTSVMRMHTSVPLKNLEDYQNYLKRLKAVPKFFKQNRINMERGLARNFSMPKVVMKGFSNVILAAYDKGWEKTAFWVVFQSMPDSIDRKARAKLQNEAKIVIKDSVVPAFKTLYEFFENTYIPQTKKSLGAFDFPNGKAYYGDQVNHYTTLTLSPEDIHEIGLAEVKRIRNEMEAVIKDAKFDGTFKEFLKFLRESPQFYAKTAEDLIKEASYMAKKADGQLPKFFTRLPRQPYTVEPVPDAIAIELFLNDFGPRRRTGSS